MKRPRDDGSSRGESYGQSEIPERGLGGGGGGSRKADANNKPKLTMDDAFSYLKEVKDMFPDQKEKYGMFLKVMKDFKNRRIDIVGVIARVKDLFKGHPSLILGLNPFMPEGYKIILNDDDEAPQRKTDYLDLAMSLVNKIKERLGNDHEFKSFLNIMNMHGKKGKGIKEVYQESYFENISFESMVYQKEPLNPTLPVWVAVLLNDHPDLLDEFTGFLPVGAIDQSNLDEDKEQKTCAEKENRDRRTRDEDHKDVRKAEVPPQRRMFLRHF